MRFVKIPYWLPYFFPSLVWHKDRSEKSVYLTFDDGPIPEVTPFVLQALRRVGAKATFFCVGDNVEKHPEIFQQVKSDGHALGNHTYNHLNGLKTPDAHYLQNIDQAEQLLTTPLFRPPYGTIRKSQIAALQKARPEIQIIMWDVLSYDFDPRVSPKQCLDYVVKHVQAGSIIVFHDSLKAFDRLVYALPHLLEYLLKEGYSFGTL